MNKEALHKPSNAPLTSELQMATPGHIRSLLLNGRQPVVLLGAGASVTSGIPAAGPTVDKAARWAWCEAVGRSPEDIRIQRSDYWPWLRQQSWFSPERSLAEQYPTAIKKLLGVRRTRREFFEKLISPGIQPNVGYRSLVRILNEGWVSTLLTTNFDHCIEDARVLENKPHLLVSIKTSDDLVRFSASPSAPQLIYLHGSVEHYSDKNLDEETASLDPRLIDRVVPLLRDHPVVIVGYRGAETSVMKMLFQEQMEKTNLFAQGVYWCIRETELAEGLAPKVQEFAAAIGANFSLVSIKGFDELLQLDLWDRLAAEGALPERHLGNFRPVEIPSDMRPMDGASLEALDEKTLFSRLTQYAKRLGLIAPDVDKGNWLETESYRRNLFTEEKGLRLPTLAGWLLFARTPQDLLPHATIQFRASGPPHWIARCFGEDANTGELDNEGNVSVEQEISGNLWAQLDAISDLLSLVNLEFRLKEEISRTVYPFAPLALKEVLVNALVHRNYECPEPIRITVTPGKLEVISPGGLIDEVASQTAGKDLEAVITSGGRGIKGYRNPVISDLFYGGGQMDRSGSGLADIWSQTVNNNGEAHFGPDEANAYFTALIYARPEAVDEITNTATPVNTDTVRYAANLLPIDTMPEKIWHAGTTATSAWRLAKDAEGLALPCGFVQDGRFFTLYDLESLAARNVTPFEEGDIEWLSVEELLSQPNGENILLKLMHEVLFEHLRSLKLKVEYKRRRTYFTKSAEGERKITYKGRVKRATRTVVKARTRRNSADVLYYEHKAMAFSVLRFGTEWAVVITPCYSFTRDGEGKPIGREKINILSTRRAARDFNPSVHHDVSFWAAVLSEEAEGVFALKCEEENHLADFAPTILLSRRLPTISFNTSSSGSVSEMEDEIDAGLAELEEELAALAEAEGNGDVPTDEEDPAGDH